MGMKREASPELASAATRLRDKLHLHSGVTMATRGSSQGHLFIGEKEKNGETSGGNKCNLYKHMFAASPQERTRASAAETSARCHCVLQHEYQFKEEGS